MKTRHWFAPVLAAVSMFSGCGDQTPPPANGPEGLPETTKVMDAQTFDALESVSDDLATFTFKQSTSLLNGLKEGDIIASGIHEPLLPNGALRRVDSIETTANQVKLTTSYTGLAQAIGEGTIQTRIPLLAENALANGKSIPRNLGPGQLVFAFNDVVLYDFDQSESTSNDQVIMNGNLTMDPEIVIDIEIGNFTLKKAAIEVVGTTTASISIEARREAAFSYENVLLTVPFTPIEIQVGPVPVVFVPILELRAGANGKFTAGMATDITLVADTVVGLGYDGGFGPVLEVSPSGDAQVPSLKDGGKAEGTVWLGSRFKVAVYGLAGAYVESRFYGRLQVDTNACPWWELFAGVEGRAGAFAGISVELLIFDADISIFDWKTDPLKKEVSLADAGDCAPSSSQSGLDTINWARSYGNAGIDYPIALAATSDGGAVVAGATFSYTPGSLAPDASLLKVDLLGHVAWQVGFDDLYAATAVQPIDDGYFLLAGEVSLQTEEPSYLLRLNANGAPLWAKAISASVPLDAVAMSLLPGGDVMVSGNFDEQDNADVFVARFTPDGDPVWALSSGGPANEQVKSMIVDSAGDVVVLADSESFVSPGDINCNWVIKLDPDGNRLWQNCYVGQHPDFAGAVVELPGGYALIGDLASDAEMNQISIDGQLLGARHFNGGTKFDKAYAATAMPNGHLLIVGRRGLGTGSDVWAFRVAENGGILWSRIYGGSNADAAGGLSQYAALASAVVVTPDGGAIIAGNTQSFGAGNLDTWLLKIRSVGTLDFDTASGAISQAVTGGTIPLKHTTAALSAATQPIKLTIADVSPVFYSTNVQVAQQAGAP